jgi:hypothetical protein
MGKQQFTFELQRKYTAIESGEFTVEADNYEDAVKMAKAMVENDEADDAICNQDGWGSSHDNYDHMFPSENNGRPTVELIDEDGLSVWHNAGEGWNGWEEYNGIENLTLRFTQDGTDGSDFNPSINDIIKG